MRATRRAPGSTSMLLVCLLTCLAIAGQKTRSGAEKALLAKVGDYVSRYEEQFSNIIGQEDYTQRLTQSSAGRQTKIQMKTRSDILLVWSEPDHSWVTFRDTYMVNGKEIRKNVDRLQKLFSEGSPELRRIADESARYNLGDIVRNFNVPTLVLSFFRPGNQSGFKYTIGKAKEKNGQKLVTVKFEEQQSPTLIRSQETDLFAKGYFMADPETGVIHETQLEVGGIRRGIPLARITVQYQFHPELGLMVPAKMRERYEEQHQLFEDPVECWATYSNFRKFSVEVEQEIDSRR